MTTVHSSYSLWTDAFANGSLEDLQTIADHEGLTHFQEATFSNLPLSVWAVRHQRKDLLQGLLDQGYPVDPKEGYSALHEAAATGQQDVVKFLIHLGADPLKKTKQGFLPIDLAAQNGFSELCEWFYDQTKVASAALITHLTKSKPSPEGLSFLKKTIQDTPSYFSDMNGALALLNVFLQEKDLHTVQVLLGKEAPLQNTKTESPRNHYALRQEPLQVIANMGNGGIAWLDLWVETAEKRHLCLDWDRGEQSAVFIAAQNKQYDLVRRFLEHGAPYQVTGSYGQTRSLLVDSVGNASLPLVKMLVDDFKAPLNYKETGTSTREEYGLLELAAKNRQNLKEAAQVFDYLLDRKLTWQTYAQSSGCSMWNALEAGNVAIVEKLVALGDDLHKEIKGTSALHKSIGYSVCSKEMLHYLLSQGVSPYAKGSGYQDDPITRILQDNKTEHFEMLMAHGVDLNHRSSKGKAYSTYLSSNNKKIADSYAAHEELKKTTPTIKRKKSGPRL